MSRRARLLWAGAVAVLVMLVLLTPQAEGPDSTLALRRYLTNLGFEVRDDASLPEPPGTLILLQDLRQPDEERTILDWVEQGGRLVVADPDSPIVGILGASYAGPIGFVGTLDLEPRCLASEVVGVGAVVVRASDAALSADAAEFVSCIQAAEGSFLLTRRHGEGTVTLLGGVSPLTNELLPNRDNAVLAAQLAGPGRRVVFGPALPAGPTGTTDLWGLLPQSARVAAVALILAVVLFAARRARRLGRPVIEAPVAPIPASELVHATARMFRRARAVAYCGTILREFAAQRFSRARGLAPRAEGLAATVAHASELPEARVDEILRGTDPRTDEDLIMLGRDLEELASRTRVAGG
jgi:Domain of unknown function (DUF4350)